MIAFLDASALMVLLEGQGSWSEAVKTQMRELAAADQATGSATAIGASRLSWLECRVGPLRRKDQAAPDLFDTFFALPGLCWGDLSATVVEQATVEQVTVEQATTLWAPAATAPPLPTLAPRLPCMTVLITGAAGLIGPHRSRLVLQRLAAACGDRLAVETAL